MECLDYYMFNTDTSVTLLIVIFHRLVSLCSTFTNFVTKRMTNRFSRQKQTYGRCVETASSRPAASADRHNADECFLQGQAPITGAGGTANTTQPMMYEHFYRCILAPHRFVAKMESFPETHSNTMYPFFHI